MTPKNYTKLSASARMLIDYFNDRVYDNTLERLTDCFVGFSLDMQGQMVKFFIDEYFCFDFPPFTNQAYTGVWHVDRLLIEMLEMIHADLDEKEKED